MPLAKNSNDLNSKTRPKSTIGPIKCFQIKHSDLLIKQKREMAR